MVKRVVEAFECDLCGDEAERYTVSFRDGYLALDRCLKHSKVLEKLRNEKGTWHAANSTRVGTFRISTPEEIDAARRLSAVDGKH